MDIEKLSTCQLQNLLRMQFELYQIEKLISFYTEVLSFLLQYSFIFDESPAETESLTPDPARDGSNWYGYAGQNPLIYVDPTGLAYYTGPTGSSVQSSNTPVTPHDFSETRGPSGRPAGTPKIPEAPEQPETTVSTQNVTLAVDRGIHKRKIRENKEGKKLFIELKELFSLNVKVGIGINANFISKIGLDLGSLQASFSSEGYKEEFTVGITNGIVGYSNSTPLIEGEAAIEGLIHNGNNTVNFGPITMSEKGNKDIDISIGFQIIVGIDFHISVMEAIDFWGKLNDKVYGKENSK